MTGGKPRPIAGIVFDLDGTLIHSAPDIAAALNIVLAEHGLAPFPLDEALGFVGEGAKVLVEKAFAARGRVLSDAETAELTARYLTTYAQHGSPNTTLFPAVRETLVALGELGVPLAVCTNKAEQISRDVLAQFDLDTIFEAVVGGDSGFGRKPDAGPLVECSRCMGVAAEDVLMVGDTKFDVGAARNAGARSAVVTYGYSRSPVAGLGADLVLDDFARLVDLVNA
jgi:phosphoglycolate phosphatase